MTNSADKVVMLWKCKFCGYRVGFLPPDLESFCPKCGQTKAKDFITKAGNVPWLNDGCPGWSDSEPAPFPDDHIPGDKGCRCHVCTEYRALLAEWKGEGDR